MVTDAKWNFPWDVMEKFWATFNFISELFNLEKKK